MLRTLLTHADEDPQVAELGGAGGRAFVSQSLRPNQLTALLDHQWFERQTDGYHLTSLAYAEVIHP
jgi:hypothetical protein